ncbi:MFS transporter [Pseudomonas argentinensis]|uniref:MFS transporter n=1 Tax=Phytopseudomonas argentinensis TaxID=289370 RepID=UPI001F357DB7|nr:MFS transporter [Pseudomonas argentinensis]
MLVRNPTLLILFLAQALYWSCSLIGITLTALIGMQLSPYNGLATLPLALLVLGNLLATHPLSLFMQHQGRRPGLTLGAAAGILGGLISALGVWLGDFILFCLGALPIGVYQASAMYYRFAALETVDDAHKGRAAAWVIAGGVCAALIAPSLTLWARNAMSTPFVGAYVLLAGLALLGLLLLSTLREGAIAVAPRGDVRSLLARPAIRSALAVTAIGHGLMILVMNATPLAMSFCGLPLDSAAQVIQWHMLGMFLPALIAGPLVDRLGSRPVAMLGIAMLGGSALVGLSGQAQAYFLISSLLLGIGWNLMLVAGTTLLASAHEPAERGKAQGLMELANGSVAACAAFASGALITGLGWFQVNLAMLPLLVIALMALLIRPVTRAPAAS